MTNRRPLLWEVARVSREPLRLPITLLIFVPFAAVCFTAAMYLAEHAETLEQPHMWRAVTEAVEQVESNGKADAVNGDAVGILQIRPIMVEEVNRILELEGREERYELDDRLDVLKSRAMFSIYSMYWCSQNADWTDEGIARRWLGGPDGHTEQATHAYWERVQALISAGDNGSSAK